MKKFIIVCRSAGVFDVVFYDRQYTERWKRNILEIWPGLEWQIEQVNCGFPVSGLKHPGEVRAPKILKHHIRDLVGNAHLPTMAAA